MEGGGGKKGLAARNGKDEKEATLRGVRICGKTRRASGGRLGSMRPISRARDSLPALDCILYTMSIYYIHILYTVYYILYVYCTIQGSLMGQMLLLDILF